LQIFERQSADEHVAERTWPVDVAAGVVRTQALDFFVILFIDTSKRFVDRYVDTNTLTGAIPSDLGKLTELQFL
jgi:hypothetical protein